MIRAWLGPSIRAASIVAALGVGGCCNIPVDFDPDDPLGRDRPPDDDEGDDDDDDGKTANGHVDIGTAAYPSANRAKRAAHPWWLPELKPSKYELGYKLDDVAGEGIHEAYRRWARQVGHKKLDENRFQWHPPQRCHGGLHCVYETLEESSDPGVEPIADLFRRRASKARLDVGELASLVLTFVQEIEYKIPKDEPFGVMPPALVVKNRWGDCDSKTLLAHMLLRSIGIRSVLISSNAHKHTMLGVAVPAAGRSFTYQGTKYAFVELTAKRSPIGHINPQLLRPNDWRVVEMRYRPVGALPTPDDAIDPPKKKKKKKDEGSSRTAGVRGGGRINVR